MGWTHCFDSKYAKWKCGTGAVMPPASRRMEIDDMLNSDSKDEKGNVVASFKVLKSAMVGSTYYGAVRIEKPGQEPKVTAAVFLTCGRTKHDHTIWGYKDMDETVGPCESKCPASILALLTPTDSKWANEWRERCRKNIAEAAERRKNGPKPLYAPKGVTIEVLRKSWIISSPEYRYSSGYSGVRFSMASWHDPDRAMCHFLAKHGTEGQKREFAESGRECPEGWKGVAA